MMFTGLIQEIGIVQKINQLSDSAQIIIGCSNTLKMMSIGDSVSVNGACLTVSSKEENSFTADVMSKTLELTSLGRLENNQKVNLELAMAATDRFGGHLVQGHVDDVAVVIDKIEKSEWTILRLRIPERLTKYVVAQGSICLDGVSLTIGEVQNDQVSVWLIPTTLEKTNLGNKVFGDILNLEVDLLAKYVEKLLIRQDKNVK